MDEPLGKWSEVSDEEANEYRRDPIRRVAGPGGALVLVECIGMMANFLLVMLFHEIRDRGPVERPSGMDDNTLQDYERGRAAAPMYDLCLISVPTIPVYSVVIAAGIRMRRLQSRQLAVVGAVLAMMPCSPAMLFGLPVGVWALLRLSDLAVRAAFSRGQAGQALEMM